MADKKVNTTYEKLVKEGADLYEKGLYKESIKVLKTAFVMAKDLDIYSLGTLYIRLGNAYYKLDDKDKYIYYYELYLEKFPEGQASVFSRLSRGYYYFNVEKAIDYSNKSLNLEMNQCDVARKIFAMTKSSFYTQQEIKEEAELEIERLKNTIFKNVKKYIHNDKKNKKEKKLNIGYLTSDCHNHTMMHYILPILKNHNKEQFNIYVFNTSEKNDFITDEVKQTVDEMIFCKEKSIESLAKLIYDKNIDILVELSGYTHLKSFVSFYKPAPVIISYLGYLNTLGMKDVDYIFTDKYSIPEEKAYLYTEKPLYLDLYQVFSNKTIPDITDSPFKTNDYITFGSFNCSSKLNDITLFLWSEILKAVPDSKLLVYRTQFTKKNIIYIVEKFEKLGINRERLIVNLKKTGPHYEVYSLVDISLDPYPFSGLSIGIENAMMGVPTVTMDGEGMQSKGVSRINKILGLDELLNSSCGEDYIRIAVNLAKNKEKLAELRNTLRKNIMESELFTGAEKITRDMEEKYKEAWQNFINNP